MIRLAHISDTHFGTEIPAVVQALYNTLTSLKPDLLVLSGDITQRARRGQFSAARNFLEALAIPYLAIPGNHDIPLFDVFTRFTNPYRNYLKFFGNRECVRVVDNTAFVGLDATSPLRHKQGALNEEHVGKILADARQGAGPSGQIIVSVHQPLMTAWQEDRSEEMNEEGKVAELFARHQVDLVLSGHVHVPLICSSFKAYPDLPYSFVHSGAGTAISHRTREGKPNSFNFLEIGSTDILVAQYDYRAGSKSFIALEKNHFLREPQGWKIR
jgi:3',5'-cyclic AMP phosphodiesterase CpdA